LSLQMEAIRGLAPANQADAKKKLADRRNRLYVRLEKLQALLAPVGAKKILFSDKPEWEEHIRLGFKHLPHQVDFGTISEDSFDRYDIVVPLTIAALERALEHSPHQRSALPLPNADTIRLCDDKYKFNRALIEQGFGRYIPEVVQGQQLKPPYILKKRTGWWGKNCYMIRNSEDERIHLDLIDDPEYFCQRVIAGPSEFATHILFVDGRIVKALNIKYQFAGDIPIKGQDHFLFQVIHRCPYLDLFARVLNAVGFEGLCCVNYKVANGQPFLLEINPRFGGSLAPYFFSFVRHLG
jgi:predicted ATP-grasp superfamily ATP-dependent carboligase